MSAAVSPATSCSRTVSPMMFSPVACAVLALFVAATPALRAQSFDQVAPKTMPTAPAALPADAPAEDSSAAADAVIVPMLRGLAFVASRAPAGTTGGSFEGLQIAGVPLLDTAEFRSLASPYLGQPLTLRMLNRLTRDAVLYFRRHGRPVVDVLVPEQNVSGGTVQLLVVEGRLGNVLTEGNKWFTSEQVRSYVRARTGEVIEGAPLLADIAWINQNPFRQVDLVFARGEKAGETDVILRTIDRYPLRVYAGYDDSGNALTGFDRIVAGANWGNAFGRDQQLNYQLTASPDFRKLVAHSASHLLPIAAWRHTLTTFVSFAESRPELAGGLFALKGRAWQIGARYRIPLPARGTLTRELTAGVDFKRSNNNLSFGGTRVFAQENDVVQGSLAFSTSRPDKHGMMSGLLAVYASPGGLSADNRTAAFRTARSGARADYVYGRLELERLTKLPQQFSWVTRASAQLSSANLLGSEQLGLGGGANLRGYEEREANGDDGFVLVNELHAPAIRSSGWFGHGQQPSRFTPLVFFDYGIVTSHDRLRDEPKRLELASAGPGIRYNYGGNVSIRADFGWQLKSSGVSDGRRHQRGHLSVILAY